jgi:hypothetical protein
MKAERVERWVVLDALGRYAMDEYGSTFSEDFEDAYIFVGPPRPTVGLRPARVTVSLVKGA